MAKGEKGRLCLPNLEPLAGLVARYQDSKSNNNTHTLTTTEAQKQINLQYFLFSVVKLCIYIAIDTLQEMSPYT